MNRAGGKRKEGKKEKRERRQAGKGDTWILESLWNDFDVTLGLLWVYEGHFGITLASLGGLLGGFWVYEGGFGQLWGHFGSTFGPLCCHFGRSMVPDHVENLFDVQNLWLGRTEN